MFLIFVHKDCYNMILEEHKLREATDTQSKEHLFLFLLEFSISAGTDKCSEISLIIVMSQDRPFPGWWVTFHPLELDIDLRVSLRSKSWPIVKINIWDSLGISASSLQPWLCMLEHSDLQCLTKTSFSWLIKAWSPGEIEPGSAASQARRSKSKQCKM